MLYCILKGSAACSKHFGGIANGGASHLNGRDQNVDLGLGGRSISIIS
jgi:hypothetical protein